MMGVQEFQDQYPKVFIFPDAPDLLIEKIGCGKEELPLDVNDRDFGFRTFRFIRKLGELSFLIIAVLDHLGLRDFFQEKEDGRNDASEDGHLKGYNQAHSKGYEKGNRIRAGCLGNGLDLPRLDQGGANENN